MLFLWLIILVNAVVSETGFVLKYRLNLFGTPLNVFDGFMIIGLIFAPIAARSRAARLKTKGMHPVFKWTVGLYLLSLVIGTVVGLFTVSYVTFMLQGLRNFAALPIALVFGYCFLQSPKGSIRVVYAHVLAGILSAFMILLFFRDASGKLEYSATNIDALRTIDYVSVFGALAAAVLILGVTLRIRLLPTWLSLCIAGLGVIGQCATLSRSDWVAAVAALGAVAIILPGGREMRRRRLVYLLSIPVLLASVWGAAYITDKTTSSDFTGRIVSRLQSMLPGGDGTKAWDTRTSGIAFELGLWSGMPLTGTGIGSEANTEEVVLQKLMNAHHNAWTNTLCELGPVGVAALLTLMIGTFVVGRRMVRDRQDRGSVLLGGLGAIAVVSIGVHGMCTGSFNSFRGGFLLGLICGAALRARAMQLAVKEQWAGYVDDPADLGTLLEAGMSPAHSFG